MMWSEMMICAVILKKGAVRSTVCFESSEAVASSLPGVKFSCFHHARASISVPPSTKSLRDRSCVLLPKASQANFDF